MNVNCEYSQLIICDIYLRSKTVYFLSFPINIRRIASKGYFFLDQRKKYINRQTIPVTDIGGGGILSAPSFPENYVRLSHRNMPLYTNSVRLCKTVLPKRLCVS